MKSLNKNDRKSVWINEVSLTSEWIVAEYYKPMFLEIIRKIKENSSNTFKFKEIADINRVTGFEVERYLEIVEIGIPYLRVSNVAECFIDFDNMQYIPEYVHHKFSKSQFKKNDIALTITGRVGTAAIIGDSKDYNACQDVVKVSLKRDDIDPYYLVLYLNTSYNYYLLNRFHSGGSRPRTLINNVREVLIPIPSSKVQEYIGNKVRKAESLLSEAEKNKKEAETELNNCLQLNKLEDDLRINRERFSWISEMSMKDRMDGEYYKKDFIINNEYIENLKTENIQVVKLKDIMKKGSYGILPSSNDYGTGNVGFLRSTNLKEFLIDDSDMISVPDSYLSEKARVLDGDILLEIKGQCIAGAIFEKMENEVIVNGSIFKFSTKEEYDNYYILAYLLCVSGQLQKKQNLANSIISYLSIDCIKGLKIPVIPTEYQRNIGGKFKLYVKGVNESKRLIDEAKKDVDDLIEGTFDMSKLNDITTESRC